MQILILRRSIPGNAPDLWLLSKRSRSNIAHAHRPPKADPLWCKSYLRRVMGNVGLLFLICETALKLLLLSAKSDRTHPATVLKCISQRKFLILQRNLFMNRLGIAKMKGSITMRYGYSGGDLKLILQLGKGSSHCLSHCNDEL
jgi:hypothetical protein